MKSTALSSLQALGTWLFVKYRKPMCVMVIGFVAYPQGPNLELDSRASSASRSGVARKSSTQSFSFLGRAAEKAWLKQLELLHQFVDDWKWRIGVLQRLSPSSQQWREALAVLQAAPSTILNMCVQRNQYDLGQEAVHCFQLSPEEAASLQLAQWVDSATSRASVDDAISRVAEELSNADDNLDFTAPLAPLATVLLCVDVAATSMRSVNMARRLLDRALGLLSQIQQAGQRGQGPEQRQEAFEALCQSDPEGLAVRLAGKGVVSAALDVAESFNLSSDLRRELQGRQLVKLLTTDPINGGGPAGGLRFLNSLLHPEDALPVTMAAMELLPNLQWKQWSLSQF